MMTTRELGTKRNIRDATASFSVLHTAEKLQSATMRLDPGSASGPFGNEHAQSEQVLFVVEGQIIAEIGDRKFVMTAGECVIVPRNVPHRFSNETTTPALTFNVYAPPAY